MKASIIHCFYLAMRLDSLQTIDTLLAPLQTRHTSSYPIISCSPLHLPPKTVGASTSCSPTFSWGAYPPPPSYSSPDLHVSCPLLGRSRKSCQRYHMLRGRWWWWWWWHQTQAFQQSYCRARGLKRCSSDSPCCAPIAQHYSPESEVKMILELAQVGQQQW